MRLVYFLYYKLEEIELILFFGSCIIQIFVHQVCMNWLFYTVKLVESYKLYHTNRLCKSGYVNDLYDTTCMIQLV